ncbi:MAG: hypothetical protein P4L20_13650, partial [Acidimicrobiales bacterium]|nr:hypothetical protein [Acidimicrobiales bacterium]
MLEAFPLCPGSLPVVGTTCGVVSGLAGSVATAGVSALFSEAARWVASGAVWLIAQVGRAMSATTSIDLSAGWFAAHEAVMASLAAAVVLPMACCAAIQAVYRQSASMLLRTFLVHLPLSLLLTGVAVTLVRMALAITDSMSATILSSAGVDTTNLFSGLFVFLTPVGVATVGIVPGFVVLIGSLLVAGAALALWLELVVRAAAVSVAVLFLPLALAALVWPSVAHWCRRLADTLVALVLSKLVVAAVLSLAASAVAGGVGSSGSGSGGGFASVVTGIALLVIAVLSPFTLLRLVPAVEAGAVAHLESARHRLKGAAASPVRAGRNLALEQMNPMKEKPQGGAAASVGTVGSVGTDDGDPVDSRDTGSGAETASATAMVPGDPMMAAVFSAVPTGGASVAGAAVVGASAAGVSGAGVAGSGVSGAGVVGSGVAGSGAPA